MKRFEYVCFFLLISGIFLSAKDGFAADLYLNEPLNGIYATGNGSIIAQSNCKVINQASATLIANYLIFQSGFHVESGGKLIILKPGDDSDGDELTNYEEYQLGTDLNDSDTDNDGMPDGWEHQFGLNPLLNDASGNLDNDGASNIIEYVLGTDPDDNISMPAKGVYYEYDAIGRIKTVIRIK